MIYNLNGNLFLSVFEVIVLLFFAQNWFQSFDQTIDQFGKIAVKAFKKKGYETYCGLLAEKYTNQYLFLPSLTRNANRCELSS